MSEAITAAGPRNYLPGDLFERPLRNDYDLIGRVCVRVCVMDGCSVGRRRLPSRLFVCPSVCAFLKTNKERESE